MWPFRKKEERDLSIEELIASAKLSATDVNKDKALQIPEVAACTNLISNVIAGLPIKLYKEQNGNAIFHPMDSSAFSTTLHNIYEELTMKEVAEVLDITESRVSQIHTSAMQKLKRRLKDIYE